MGLTKRSGSGDRQRDQIKARKFGQNNAKNRNMQSVQPDPNGNRAARRAANKK